MNILFGDNHVQTVEIGKRGDALRYHPGIKNLIKKKFCSLIFTKEN
jgi:hypothetical protein